MELQPIETCTQAWKRALAVQRQVGRRSAVVRRRSAPRATPRRPRRATRRGAGSSPARTRRRRTDRARRSAPAAPRRSSRRRRSRAPGSARLRAPASPRWARSFVSGFSRIVQVLKTRTSASSCDGCLAEPERLEHALDPLGVVRVHLAAERGDVVPLHRARQRSRALLRDLDRAALADHGHLDLARVLELVLDLARDLVREEHGAVVVDLGRLDDDADLAAGLERVRLRRRRASPPRSPRAPRAA